MSDAQSQVPPSPAEDIDLYCLKCGYNLRGLSGDPRRCPECFYMNPMGDLELPAPFISAQLRRMESAPAYCVACVFFAGLFALPPAALMLSVLRGQPFEQDTFCCFGSVLLGMIGAWVAFAMQFRNSCLGKPGWFATLLRFHAYGLVMISAVIGIIWLGTELLDIAAPGTKFGRPPALRLCGLAALGICVLLGSSWIAPRLHARAKGNMEQLQREVAVQLARERLRRKLASDKR
ncbi:MAG TPA: hypothetical protein VMV94_03155 [Phycisphaerae bacterium]|nr:hypothetical protein [Phycisphaerae bacterium]